MKKRFLRCPPGKGRGRRQRSACSMRLGGLLAQELLTCYVTLIQSLSLSEPVTYSERAPVPYLGCHRGPRNGRGRAELRVSY